MFIVYLMKPKRKRQAQKRQKQIENSTIFESIGPATTTNHLLLPTTNKHKLRTQYTYMYEKKFLIL